MSKDVTPHIEIKDKKLILTTLNQSAKDNKIATINYLIEHDFIEPHEIIKDDIISNLYKVKFKNRLEYEYVFITDIRKSGGKTFSRNHEKRVFINKANTKILDFIKNHKIHFIAGYCVFDTHVFLYSNSPYLVINTNYRETAAPVDLCWLLRSAVNDESFIVFNTNKSKYPTALITSDFNQVIKAINDEHYEQKYQHLDNNIDFYEYHQQINDYMNEIKNNFEVIKFFGNLDNYQKRTYVNKKFDRDFMQSHRDDQTKIDSEIQINVSQFTSEDIMKKIKEYSSIDPLKIECVFDDLIKNDNNIQIAFENITGQLYEYHLWNNKECETYQQYDFVINENIYIDVKSTWKNNHVSFFISQKENNFRLANKDNYLIALFYDIHFDENNYLKYKFMFLDNMQIDKLDYKVNYEYFINKK